MHMMADAWILNGYKLKRLYLSKEKVTFEALFEDAEMVKIPSAILNHKVPKKAKFELEHFMAEIIKKYRLTDEDYIPRKRSGNGGEGD